MTTQGNSKAKCKGRSHLWKWLWLLAAGFPSLVLAVVFLRNMQASFRELDESMCCQQLKRLSLALGAYHDAYGSLPPLYMVDDEGIPIHSWRVLILPYTPYDDFYARYDFSVPWDDPHNLALSQEFPGIAEMFHCPSDTANTDGETNYLAIDWTMASGPDDGVAYSSVPIVQYPIVEIAESGIHWMEPRDLTCNELTKGLVARSPHDGRSHFVTSASAWHVLERHRVTLNGRESEWLGEWPTRWVPDVRGEQTVADKP